MAHATIPRLSRFVLLGFGALALVGCQSIREAAGITKQPPDEFAVATKAPLVIPPDFNLRPPRPGAPPTNQISPTAASEEALYNGDPNAIAGSINGNYSQGEKLLLATAGAANASDGIRAQIAADNSNSQATSDSFTNQLLFGGGSDNQGTPVDADAEAKRLQAAKNAGVSNPGGGDQAAPAQSGSSATIQKTGNGSSKDDNGWLGNIF